MTREEALKMVKENVKNKNLLKHMYAAEAVMGGLARHFGEDEELWKLAGLLHDIDYDETKDDVTRHSLLGGEILAKAGLPEEVVYAVKCHNDYHGLERKSLLDKALYATDPLTGLIVAAALIRPEKKLELVDVSFLMNRFQEKSFARGARREVIASCTEMGLTLEEFMGIGLKAMQEVHRELGL
ncbi:MAG: HDIG domain-containing metalloprotein [Peptococcia bacterium]